MKRIFWTLANAQGAESSESIFFDCSCDVEGITKSDLVAVYFYIREGRREIWEVSQFLDNRTKAYLCVMNLFQNDFIRPEIEEDRIIPEGYHENFSALSKCEVDLNDVGK